MARELRQSHPDRSIAVLNAGIAAYSPLLESYQFDGIIRHYDPQLVLLLLDTTDIVDDYRYGLMVEPGSRDGPFGPVDNREERQLGALGNLSRPLLLRLAAAARVPVQLLARYSGQSSAGSPHSGQRRWPFAVEVGGVVEPDHFFIYRHPLAETRPFFDVTFMHIRRIAASCRAMGAAFVLIPAPRYLHWSSREGRAIPAIGGHGRDNPYPDEYFRYFEQPEIRAQVAVFDIVDAFRQTTEFPLVFENDPHWNERGHAFVGKTVARYVLDHHPELFAERPAAPVTPF